MPSWLFFFFFLISSYISRSRANYRYMLIVGKGGPTFTLYRLRTSKHVSAADKFLIYTIRPNVWIIFSCAIIEGKLFFVSLSDFISRGRIKSTTLFRFWELKKIFYGNFQQNILWSMTPTRYNASKTSGIILRRKSRKQPRINNLPPPPPNKNQYQCQKS